MQSTTSMTISQAAQSPDEQARRHVLDFVFADLRVRAEIGLNDRWAAIWEIRVATVPLPRPR